MAIGTRYAGQSAYLPLTLTRVIFAWSVVSEYTALSLSVAPFVITSFMEYVIHFDSVSIFVAWYRTMHSNRTRQRVNHTQVKS